MNKIVNLTQHPATPEQVKARLAQYIKQCALVAWIFKTWCTTHGINMSKLMKEGNNNDVAKGE